MRTPSALRDRVARHVLAAGASLVVVAALPAAARQEGAAVLDALEPTQVVSATADDEPLPGHAVQGEIADGGTAVVFTNERSPAARSFANDRLWESFLSGSRGESGVELRWPSGDTEVFVRDLHDGDLDAVSEPYWRTTAQAETSVAHTAYSPTVTADGSAVFFVLAWRDNPSATHFVQVRYQIIEWDRASSTGRVVAGPTTDPLTDLTVSADGSVVAWQRMGVDGEISSCDALAGNDRTAQVEVLDRESGTSPRVITCAAEPDLAADGSRLAVTSTSGRLQVVVYDVTSEPTAIARVDVGGGVGGSIQPSLSADGSRVAATLVVSGGGPASTTAVVAQVETQWRVGVFDLDPNRVSGEPESLDDPQLVEQPEGSVDDSPDLSPDGELVGFTRTLPLTDSQSVGITPTFRALAELLGADGMAVRTGRSVAMVTGVDNLTAASEVATLDAGATDTIDLAESGAGLAFAGLDRTVIVRIRSGLQIPGIAGEPGDGAIDVYARAGGALLQVDPAQVDFGVHEQGSAPVDQAVTVRSVGSAAAEIADISLVGADAGLSVRSTTCIGVVLGPGLSCQVVLRFDPAIEGRAAATLLIDAVRPLDTLRVPIAGEAVDTGDALLEIDPPAGPDGFVPVVTGTGFDPGVVVVLRWADGSGIEPVTVVTASGTGTFEADMLVFPNSLTGERVLEALVDATVLGDDAEGGTRIAEVDYLVTLSTVSDADGLFRG